MDFSEDITDEIFRIFQVESEEIISRLNNNLLSLEKNPNDKEKILLLFRDAHSLKGAARMIGFNDVQTLAHKMEDVLGLARDNKISLNSKVVNILYKTVDFLFAIIQKSLPKKQEIHSEEIAKQISVLDNIESYTDFSKPNKQSETFNKKAFSLHYKTVSALITECLILLMKIEAKENEAGYIKELFVKITELQNIFKDIGFFEIKKEIDDIAFKLNFTMKASNELTIAETREIHSIIDDIINKINTVCEEENIEIADYYSEVFEQMPLAESKQTTVEINLEASVNPEKENLSTEESLKKIKDKFNLFLKNSCSISDILVEIQGSLNTYKNNNVKNILQKIMYILNYALEQEIKLNEETLQVILQSIDYCDNILNPQSEVEDKDLIFQQLEVIGQILEIENRKTDKPVQNNLEMLAKTAGFSEVFNTGEIKTMRVNSSKLDELVNQINELTIEKIKLKQHLNELSEINKQILEWQKSSIKSINYLKYYDKKMQASSESPNAVLNKQFLNSFENTNQKVQKISSNITRLYRDIQEDDNKIDMSVNRLDDMIKNIRILPFATIFHLFGRMVRDIAQEKNKKINFQIIGSETTTDKKIIEEIKTPLIHIIRNAIDHGIETPDMRLKLGKAEEGRIILSAYQSNNKVIIEIKDDGSGINIPKIREKAVSKGFLSSEDVNLMTDEQITNLIFTPGFSTGDEVTSISGRGIGLDVVQTKISELNGKVKIISEPNKGCCVRIELPITMSILKVFLIKAANQVFAVPMESINYVLRKNNEDIIFKNNKNFIILNDETIDVCTLNEILNFSESLIESPKKTILILENEGKKLALCVDELLGEQEILQKKLAPPFYKLKYVSGLTTLISGEICLILNVSDLFNKKSVSKSCQNLIANKNTDNKFFKILLVDDSSTTLTMEKNILTKAGYAVETAFEPFEALEKMKNTRFNLIISDVEMPNMNGFEFLERLKTDEMFFDIPTVIVSSLESEEYKAKALKLGAKNYITKNNFSQDYFLNVVEQIKINE